MARPKRKQATAADTAATASSKRQKKNGEATASSPRLGRTSLAAAAAPRSTRRSNSRPPENTKKSVGRPRKATSTAMNSSASRSSRGSGNGASSTAKNAPDRPRTPARGTSASTNGTPIKTTQGRKKSMKTEPTENEIGTKTKISVDVPKSIASAIDTKNEHDRELEQSIGSDGPSYWLMKAEQVLGKGRDLKFSIDDLKAATEPRAWHGVRNVVARNSLRLMTKGDLAFFYHSSCKVPGIVGTMEIVEEHSVDKTAFDRDHPYYDEKSDPEKPKWHQVHVEFRQKFPKIVKLKELQKYAKEGGVLEHLRMLSQPKLSVSGVTKKEWNFIMDLVDPEDVAAASAQHQPNMIGR